MGSPSVLRMINDRAALYAMLRTGPMSRNDLEQAISISKPAAAELLRRLEESGLAHRAGHRQGGPGPKAQLWTVNERAGFAAGLDVTNPHINAVVADLTGSVLGESRLVVTENDDPIVAVKDVLGAAARNAGVLQSDIQQVVVGISGSVDPNTGMLSHAGHIPQWTGFDVQERLSRALNVPLSVENDVNLVLSDELIRGQAKGCRDVLLLWMSRGVAAAIISNGILHRGFRGSAGEFDFVPSAPGGPLVGDLIATTGVLELARKHGLTGTDVGPLLEQAVQAVRAGGDAHSDRFLATLADRIADMLASPVALIDPELVILAGDIGSGGGDELATRVRARLEELIAHRPRVVAGTGYVNSVRQGALDAALQQLRETVFGAPVDQEEGAL